MKVSKGKSQPELVAAASLLLYMVLGRPFLIQRVLIMTRYTPSVFWATGGREERRACGLLLRRGPHGLLARPCRHLRGPGDPDILAGAEGPRMANWESSQRRPTAGVSPGQPPKFLFLLFRKTGWVKKTKRKNDTIQQCRPK